jgi:hypothetical protein
MVHQVRRFRIEDHGHELVRLAGQGDVVVSADEERSFGHHQSGRYAGAGEARRGIGDPFEGDGLGPRSLGNPDSLDLFDRKSCRHGKRGPGVVPPRAAGDEHRKRSDPHDVGRRSWGSIEIPIDDADEVVSAHRYLQPIAPGP